MIDQLFGSKTRVKLLKLFFSNPNRSFYVREITRTIDEQINSVRRELSNLLTLGLITSDSTNNKLYYEVDQTYEHFAALQAMFANKPMPQANAVTDPEVGSDAEKSKTGNTKKSKSTKTEPSPAPETQDIELPEAEKWKHTGNLMGVAYSGVYTRDDVSPVDILIIGDANIAQVETVILQLEKEKNRELRYAVIASDEWKYRGQVRDKFWLQFMAAKKQIVLEKQSTFKEK